MNLASINAAIKSDSSLDEKERSFLEQPDTQRAIEKLLSGAAGAALGVAVAKYLKLSRTVQVLLGVLGYGVGRIIYDHVKNYRPPGKYNSTTGLYEIDSKRY